MTAPTTRTLGLDDWMTPPEVFGPIHELLHFDLDACATNLDAARIDPFIDPKTNALRVDWSTYGNRVWCNPPYGRGISEWFEKAGKACLNGCHLVGLLVNANTDTTYWRKWVADYPYCFCVVFIQPRVKFKRADGKPSQQAPKGTALVLYTSKQRTGVAPVHRYWNYRTETFEQTMKEFIR